MAVVKEGHLAWDGAPLFCRLSPRLLVGQPSAHSPPQRLVDLKNVLVIELRDDPPGHVLRLELPETDVLLRGALTSLQEWYGAMQEAIRYLHSEVPCELPRFQPPLPPTCPLPAVPDRRPIAASAPHVVAAGQQFSDVLRDADARWAELHQAQLRAYQQALMGPVHDPLLLAQPTLQRELYVIELLLHETQDDRKHRTPGADWAIAALTPAQQLDLQDARLTLVDALRDIARCADKAWASLQCRLTPPASPPALPSTGLHREAFLSPPDGEESPLPVQALHPSELNTTTTSSSSSSSSCCVSGCVEPDDWPGTISPAAAPPPAPMPTPSVERRTPVVVDEAMDEPCGEGSALSPARSPLDIVRLELPRTEPRFELPPPLLSRLRDLRAARERADPLPSLAMLLRPRLGGQFLEPPGSPDLIPKDTGSSCGQQEALGEQRHPSDAGSSPSSSHPRPPSSVSLSIGGRISPSSRRTEGWNRPVSRSSVASSFGPLSVEDIYMRSRALRSPMPPTPAEPDGHTHRTNFTPSSLPGSSSSSPAGSVRAALANNIPRTPASPLQPALQTSPVTWRS